MGFYGVLNAVDRMIRLVASPPARDLSRSPATGVANSNVAGADGVNLAEGVTVHLLGRGAWAGSQAAEAFATFTSASRRRAWVLLPFAVLSLVLATWRSTRVDATVATLAGYAVVALAVAVWMWLWARKYRRGDLPGHRWRSGIATYLGSARAAADPGLANWIAQLPISPSGIRPLLMAVMPQGLSIVAFERGDRWYEIPWSEITEITILDSGQWSTSAVVLRFVNGSQAIFSLRHGERMVPSLEALGAAVVVAR